MDQRLAHFPNDGAFNPTWGAPMVPMGLGQSGGTGLSLGNTSVPNDPLGSQHPLVPFFGHPRIPFESHPGLQYNRESYDYPEAWNGKNPYISMLLINRVAQEDVWPLKETLPLRKHESGMKIMWEITIFNDGLLDRTPEQAVSRFMTSKRETGMDYKTRSGAAFFVEHGFQKTEMGRQHYVAQIEQIKNATIRTLTLGCLIALMRAASKARSKDSIIPHGLTDVSAIEAAIQVEVDLFGMLAKSKNGYDEFVTQMDDFMHKRIGKPCNHFSGAHGFLSYFRDNPNNSWLAIAGTRGMTASDAEKFRSTADGRVFREWPLIPVNENERINQLVRPQMTATFIQMLDKHLRDVPAREFRIDMMDTLLYDEQLDTMRRVSFRDAVRSMGLYEKNADGSIDEDTLSPMGQLFFDGFHTWGDYLQSKNKLDDYVNTLLDKEASRSLQDWYASKDNTRVFVRRPQAAGGGGGVNGRISNVLRRSDDNTRLGLARQRGADSELERQRATERARLSYEAQCVFFPRLARTFDEDIRALYQTVYWKAIHGWRTEGAREYEEDDRKAIQKLPLALVLLEKAYEDEGRDVKGDSKSQRGYNERATRELTILITSLGVYDDLKEASHEEEHHLYYIPALQALYTTQGETIESKVDNFLRRAGDANPIALVKRLGSTLDELDFNASGHLQEPDGLAYRLQEAHAVEEPDMQTEEGVKRFLRNLRISELPSFFWWSLRNDMKPLLYAIGYRRPRHLMCGAFGLRGFGEVGWTFYGESDFQLQDNAMRKVHMGHYTLYHKSVAMNDRAVVFFPAVHPTPMNAYLGGNNTQIADASLVDELDETFVYAESSDLRFIPMHIDEQVNSVNWDITGLFHKDLGMPGVESHPRMARAYADLWKVHHGATNPLDRGFVETGPQPEQVTIARQDHQTLFKYKGSGRGDWNLFVQSRAHWGPHVYAGCGKVRRGAQKFFDITTYNDTRSIAVSFNGI